MLVGAAVDIRYTMGADLAAVFMIFTALIFRTIGVLICLAGTVMDWKERLFCVIAYLPKATVQAAIGFRPHGYGTSVWSDRIICSSYGHSDHCSAGGTWDGQYV